MISRRAFLTLPAAASLGAIACGRKKGGTGFRGYAFVANEEGQAVAAVDLEVMAVARHIPVSGNPSNIISSPSQPFVYALTKENGTVHEIAVEHMNLSRKLTMASAADSFHVSPDGTSLYVLAKEPRSLIRVALDSFQVQWKLPLTEAVENFALASDGKTAAISSNTSVRMVDLDSKTLRNPAGSGDFGDVRFLADAKTLIAADRGQRRLSLYDVASSRLVAHLPLLVRPDHLCFNADGGQLFITGEGADAVVVVYPYHTPEVAETVLAGRAPGPMAASQQFLFVANPGSGDVSILQINTRKLIAVVAVGSDPGFITVTPDDQYALVLNRKSGDISVLRVGTITKNRDRRASLLTVIPVGSKPVSAAVRAV